MFPEPLKISGSSQASRSWELQVDHALSAIGTSEKPARNERREADTQAWVWRA